MLSLQSIFTTGLSMSHFKIHIHVSLLFLLNSILAVSLFSAEPTKPISRETNSDSNQWEEFKRPGLFVMDMAQDLQGRVWIATEDKGILCYDPKAGFDGKHWQHFNDKNGLSGYDYYSIAVDKIGRIWAGSLNHGVSVFNGHSWRTYDVLAGPLGERIFDIACDQINGDVWIASNSGLTRYDSINDQWQHITSADGLPSDHISAITLDRHSSIYVGFQCNGIAIAKKASNYTKWHHVQAPMRFGLNNISSVPLKHIGKGLPTNLVNDILVLKTGHVYAATNAGLAWSKNSGATWEYIRGKNYAEKVKGLHGGIPRGHRLIGKNEMLNLLPEDYITSLAEDRKGNLVIGFRMKGVAIIGQNMKKHWINSGKSNNLPDNHICTLLPLSNGMYLVGTYGGGLGSVSIPQASAVKSNTPLINKTSDTHNSNAVRSKTLPFPSVSQPPDLAELNSIIRRLKKVPSCSKEDISSRAVTQLPDDWRTQGDWVGRYGRFRAILCGYHHPHDLTCGQGVVSWRKYIGAHRRKDDELRHWLHWYQTNNQRSLEYNPRHLVHQISKKTIKPQSPRRQAEWDDHGETYPLTYDGPHVLIDIKIPKGMYYLSFYFFNKDGHKGRNKLRDYHIVIREKHIKNLGHYNKNFYDCNVATNEEMVTFRNQRLLANARVNIFQGGVYKRFLVTGGRWITVQINRNYSFNTIISGWFLDPVEQLPFNYSKSGRWHSKKTDELLRGTKAIVDLEIRNRQHKKAITEHLVSATNVDIASANIFAALETMKDYNPIWRETKGRKIYALLAQLYGPELMQPNDIPSYTKAYEIASTSFYQIALWSFWEYGLLKRNMNSPRKLEIEWGEELRKDFARKE